MPVPPGTAQNLDKAAVNAQESECTYMTVYWQRKID